jgi:hypothetical protein
MRPSEKHREIPLNIRLYQKKNNEHIPNQEQNRIFVAVLAGYFYDFIVFNFQLF